ncbi:MAG: DUF2380 domain-containing protein [Amaricoccus sp.]|uniref:DUF2380 domain-containing protein n=1 Tax=Amaricoccus sp. TaxID=1872485 RepID=UPI0039E6A010
MSRATTALALAAALATAAAGLAAPALADQRVAVPGFEFTDGSGEVRDQRAAHTAQLALFDETLRAMLEEGGLDVAVPDCNGPCSPDGTSFEAMAAATRATGSNLLLVGALHKISTLIGTIRVTLIDLDADKTICIRSLTYRGDDAEAWTRAAEFTASDVLKACFGGATS